MGSGLQFQAANRQRNENRSLKLSIFMKKDVPLPAQQ